MKKISKLRGMQDTDPIETTKINFVENSFNEISKSYGYQEVRFPIIESTDLFKRSVGDQSDIVNKEMFTFESKSGKSMTLRPEGTAGCMRMAIETGLLMLANKDCLIKVQCSDTNVLKKVDLANFNN